MSAGANQFNQEPLFKQQFATFIFQGFSPFVAALKIWPDHAGFCYDIAARWEHDVYVQQCVEHLRTQNAEKEKKENEPLTKEEFVKEVLTASKSMADEDRIKAWRLLAEMRGFIERAAPPSVIANQTINNPVLVVRDHGTDTDWEERARAQQAKLIEHA